MFKGAGVRSVLLSTLLFFSLAISHHLGGGAFVLTLPTILILIISAIIFWIKPIKEFEGPALASLLIAFQLIGHIFSPVSSNPSELRMIFSHVIAVFATYALAKNFDAVVIVFENVIAYLFGSALFSSKIFLQRIRFNLFVELKEASKETFLEKLFGRAPPSFSSAELLSHSQ